MARLTLMCGLAGAGKTTVARTIEAATGAVRLSPDEWLVALGNDLWDPEARVRVEALQWSFAVQLLSSGVDVVLEHGFWSRAERDEARRRAREVGAEVCLRFLDVPVDELWRRLKARNAMPDAIVVIPRHVLEFWATERFEAPTAAELATFDPETETDTNAAEDRHRLGYRRVDDDPNVDVLLATMDATAGWEATQRLRAWEREQLRLRHGERLLDVGCGLGDAALALAVDLGTSGEVLGIDASSEMIAVARWRAAGAGCRARFDVGNAHALSEPDGSFDAVRCERTLQWLTDPEAAVAEMARVVRPGGRVSLIDTDWSTLAIDVGDDEIAQRVRAGFRVERARPSNIGSRLAGLLQSAGLEPVAQTSAVQVWDAWDPDRSPVPAGCFSMASLADDLVERGELDAAEREQLVATIHDAARRGAFRMALTVFAVVGSMAA